MPLISYSMMKSLAKILVLNTNRGLLATKRLCFGVKTAPSIFQATMDKMLSGLDHVFCYHCTKTYVSTTLGIHWVCIGNVLNPVN